MTPLPEVYTVAGVSIELQGPVESVDWPGGGGTVFTRVVDGNESVSTSLRVDKGEAEDGIALDRPTWVVESRERMRVCGVPAVRIVSSDPEHDITCIERTDGLPGGRKHEPPGRAVDVIFEYGGRGVRATWTARSDDFAALESDEEQFFASITCEGDPVRRDKSLRHLEAHPSE